MAPDQLTQKDFRRLLQLRVCTCWCHAPCAACTDPVSPKELAEINELTQTLDKPQTSTRDD